MRVYYNENNEIQGMEYYRKRKDGSDEPSPGNYVVADDIPLDEWNPDDYQIVDGELVRKEQSTIDARVVQEQLDKDNEDLLTSSRKYLEDTDYVAMKIAEGAATPEEYAAVIIERENKRVVIRQLTE